MTGFKSNRIVPAEDAAKDVASTNPEAADQAASGQAAAITGGAAGQERFSTFSTGFSPAAQLNPVAGSVEFAGPAGKFARMAGWASVRQGLFGEAGSPESTRQRLMGMLVAVLLVVFVTVLVRNLATGSSEDPGASQVEEVVQTAAQNYSQIQYIPPPAWPQSLRDPMRFTEKSVGDAGAEPSRLNVTALVDSPGRSSAMVNGRIVHAGDVISGARVIHIDIDGVQFEADGRKWTAKVRR